MGRHKQENTKTLNIRIRESLYETLRLQAQGQALGPYLLTCALERLIILPHVLLLTPSELTDAQEAKLQEWLAPLGLEYRCVWDESKQRVNYWLRKTDDSDTYTNSPWYYPSYYAGAPGGRMTRYDLAGHLPLLRQFMAGHLPVSDITFPVLNA